MDPKTRKHDVWALPLEGDRKPFPFLETPFDEQDARFSPDGRFVAYYSDEAERRDGKDLIYPSNEGFMAVEVKTGNTFEPGIPTLLFNPSTLGVVFGFGYSVTGDGQRFLGVSRGEETSAPALAVVVNWTAEMKR